MNLLLGVPMIIIATVADQVKTAAEFDRIGAARFLGQSEDLTSEMTANKISNFWIAKEYRQILSNRAKHLIDGNGAKRVVEQMLKYN